MDQEPPKQRSLARKIASRLRRYRAASQKRRSEYLYLSGDKRWRRLLVNLHPESLFSFFTSWDGLWFVFRIGVAAVLALAVLVTFAYFHYRHEAPATILELQSCVEGRITEFYDRTGRELLWSLREGTDCQPVHLSEVSPYFIDALISMEDKDFFRHPGYKVTSIARSVVNNLLGRPLQGGSTITQQYIKNAILKDSDRSYERKLKEIVLVPELEDAYSKEEILTAYLNTIPFGSTYGGVEAASRGYLGKPAASLTLDEAALMVASISAPNIFWNDPQRHLERRDLVLQVMLADGKISQSEHEAAKAVDSLSKVRPEATETDRSAPPPGFIMAAREQAEELICSLQSQCLNLEDGGYRIITSLSLSVQEEAETAVAAALEAEGEDGYGNAGLLIVDSGSKEVLALTDRAGEEKNQLVKPRQPGNLWQPLVYTGLLETGSWGAGRIMYDYPTFDFETLDDFQGPVSLRHALGESLLTPAVKAAYLAGYADLRALAGRLGLSMTACEENCAFQQGGGVGFTVGLHDLTSLYATFADDGRYQDIGYVRRIANRDGKTIYKRQTEASPSLDAATAFMVNDILSDSSFKPPALRKYADLAFRGVYTDNFTDNPFVAYTPETVIAGWVGGPTAEADVAGKTAAAETQSGLIEAFLKLYGRESGSWQRPDGLKLLRTNQTSGRIGSGTADFYPAGFYPADLPAATFKVNTSTGLLVGGCPAGENQRSLTTRALVPELADDDPAYGAWMRPILIKLGSRLDSNIPSQADDC